MSRTESVSFQVHPNDEQEQINLMQKFHWSLLNSQEIKTIDNHLERRGDDIYQVTSSEHYAKLTFSRSLDLPNLNDVKRLEQKFNDIENQMNKLPKPYYPKLFPGTIILWLILACIYGIGIVGWIAYYFLYYSPRKETAENLVKENSIKNNKLLNERQQVLTELEKYD